MWSDARHNLRTSLILAATILVKTAIVSTTWHRKWTAWRTSSRLSYLAGRISGATTMAMWMLRLKGRVDGRHFATSNSSPSLSWNARPAG